MVTTACVDAPTAYVPFVANARTTVLLPSVTLLFRGEIFTVRVPAPIGITTLLPMLVKCTPLTAVPESVKCTVRAAFELLRLNVNAPTSPDSDAMGSLAVTLTDGGPL